MIVCPAKLWAAEWSAQPWVTGRAEYSDNLQLRSGHTQSTTGAILDAGVHLKRSDEQGEASLTPTLRASRYDSSEPLDSNDQIVKGKWNHSSERGTWQLDGEWTHDTTLTSELEISGLVQTRKRRLQRYLSPSYSFALTPRSTIAADVSYTTVKYGDAFFTGLVNYDYRRADVSMSYQYSENCTLTGSIYGTRLTAVQIDNRTYTEGAQLQLGIALVERWNGSFGAGMYRNHSGNGESGRNGGLVNLNLIRKDEKGEWHLGINRSIDPSGTGVLVQRDQLSMLRQQRLDNRWSMNAGAYWAINKELQSISSNHDRHYRSIDIHLSRYLSHDWRAELMYFYAWQRYAGALDQAERNTFMLSIHYQEFVSME